MDLMKNESDTTEGHSMPHVMPSPAPTLSQMTTQSYPQVVNQPMFPNQQPFILVPQHGQVQMASSVPVVQAPTVYLAYAPRTTAIYEKFNGKASMILGGLQIAIGILAIIMESVGFSMAKNLRQKYRIYDIDTFNIYSSVWCGVFFIISGVLAIRAGCKKTKCLTISTFTMAAIALLFAMTLMGMASWGVADTTNTECRYCQDCFYCPDCHYDCYNCHSHDMACARFYRIAQAMAAVMLLCSLAQIMLSLWLMVICGKVACCCGKQNSCGSDCTDCCSCCYQANDQSFMFVNAATPGQGGQLIQATNPSIQPLSGVTPYQAVPPMSQVPLPQYGSGTPPPVYEAILT